MSSSISKPSYVSLDQRTHVLHRPDMYIGNVKNIDNEFYGAEYIDLNEQENTEENVDEDLDDDNKEEEIIQKKTLKKKVVTDNDIFDKEIYISKRKGTINPGLHRIFIEILSNAIDNVWRSSLTDTKSTKIKVDVSDKGMITVWNDGLTIPVEINEETGLYNPEMIFGKLLTSSNYDDKEQRMTSGRNGLGQKVVNVFSKEFSVKLFDTHTGHQYVQTWRNNMADKDKAKITSPKQKIGYTQVSFLPDFERFGVTELSQDMKSLIFRNVIDTAMITGISVFYNGNKLPVKSIKDYSLFYYSSKERDDINMVFIDSSDSKVVISPNTKGDGFSHISFVNGIETYQGGVHVESWTNAVLQPVLSKINSGIKKGNTQLTLRDIKPYFRMFIKCDLVNPSFSSQEKCYLTSPNVSNPIEKVENKHINSILKWSVIDNIKNLVKGRELNALKKIEKKKGFVKIEGLKQLVRCREGTAERC